MSHQEIYDWVLLLGNCGDFYAGPNVVSVGHSPRGYLQILRFGFSCHRLDPW